MGTATEEWTSEAQSRLEEVLSRHPAERSSTVAVLQDVQEAFGYLPAAAMRGAARHLSVPESAVYGVATFYAQFYLTRQGKHRIKVCQGTACHVRGGRRVLQTIQKNLGIKPGGTTADYLFSLERVACLGSCALSPVVMVDGAVHGSMTSAKAQELIEELRRRESEEGDGQCSA
jgi:NADH-quinone oxidoreductase subunit E